MSDVLVLANSRKKSGYCVAGKDIATNRWIRVVGNSNGSELNFSQIKYLDTSGNIQNTSYQPFNKFIRLNLGVSVPLNYQPENVLIGQTPWQEIQVGKYNATLDTPTDLWGIGDRISADDIQQGRVIISQSLYWIQVTNLQFYVNNYGTNRASFQYGVYSYDLGATMDNQIFKAIVAGHCGHNSILTVSLAGQFLNKYSGKNEHYKLVAAVF